MSPCADDQAARAAQLPRLSAWAIEIAGKKHNYGAPSVRSSTQYEINSIGSVAICGYSTLMAIAGCGAVGSMKANRSGRRRDIPSPPQAGAFHGLGSRARSEVGLVHAASHVRISSRQRDRPSFQHGNAMPKRRLS